MLKMDLKELESVEGEIGNHWYFHSKALVVQKLLNKIPITSVLDVGSGSGFFSKYLLLNSDIKEACCLDIGYHNDFDDTYAAKSIHYRRSIQENNSNLVLMMDVLEHVDDDLGLLTQYVEMSKPNTYFLLTVPAFQFLWSAHDEYLEHKRRYTLAELKSVAIKSGLSIKAENYFFGLVFPLASMLRLMQKYLLRGKTPFSQLDSHSRVTNLLLKIVCKIELNFMRFNHLAGLSVCILAKKSG